MPSDCPYCCEPYLSIGDIGAEMWVGVRTEDGQRVISVPYEWSIPINFCPICGRKLEKVKVDAD